MKIYLYYQNQINVFFLPESISGSYSFDPDENETSKLINVDAKDGKWVLFKTNEAKLVNGNSYLDEINMEINKFYIIQRDNTNYLIYTSARDEKNIKIYNYDNKINLSIGGQEQSIQYNCPYTPDFNLKITNQNNQLTLQYKQGYVYINKSKLNSQSYFIRNGDEVELLGAKLLFLNKMVIVIADPQLLQINQSVSGLIETNLTASEQLEDIEVKDKELYDENSYFSKSPRLRRIIEEKEIELSQPPQQEKNNQELPAILTAGPMITMGLASAMTMTTTITQLASGTVDLKNVWPQLLTGLTMLISTILWPFLTRHYNKKIKEKRNKELNDKYEKYLAEKKEELENERNLQAEIIKENVISLDQCLENLKHRGLNFWDKRIDQSDFLVVRIGVGDELLKVKINYPEEGFSADEDELKKRVEVLVDEYKYINNVPIGYSLYENNITAVMGESVKTHYFMNNILLQLLTFYSYDDLKIVVFTNEKNEKYWDYIKYLNHNATNDSSFRFFATNEENASYVSDMLKQELNNRLGQSGEDKQASLQKPYYLIIIDDLEVVKKTNLVEEISELKNNLGFSMIIMENKISKLPSLCNNFINIGDKKSGVLKNSYEKQEQMVFIDEVNYKINMMEIAKVLANIPIEISSGEDQYGELPDAITFLEMAKVGKVEQLNIMNRWDTNDSTSNLKAEVGVGPDGKLMYLDLHEKAHGPHGLIAGMTGSGKSEFIITWILSLSMNFSPEDVAFILIDYKGGGLAFAFENQTTGTRLPHLTGTITNLDKAEINRTLVSIDSEVKRRQKIFNEARDKLGESTIDIYKYQGFFHAGKLDEPLPHLFIVCDEFAELKAQQPDFMDNLISVARIGRSLGVHLILATQKPSGVVNDQIWSNTKFRVCLKVQDASDSNEMLKRPDAASLKQTGRFYLQVGYDEYFALGQSGWCGAKYYPSDVIQKTVDKSVNIIDESGISIKNIQSGGDNKKGEAEGEQLSAIMNEIIKIAKQSNRFAKRLWLENIPAVITIDQTIEKYKLNIDNKDFNLVIGEYDAPEKQEQYPLVYNLLNDGSTNIISTDSQEYEELVTTILYNVIKNYQPTEVSYYIIDYGSQNFQKFNKDPHCGGVVTPGDNESLPNLIKLIREEQKERKKILAEFGGEYIDYIKDNPGKMPVMIVILNNYESISESNDTLYDILGELLRDSDRYGIVYIITSSLTNSLPDRFKQLIPCTFALKLKDSADYKFLFNAKDKVEPRDIFGRGICFNEKLHEFQTAFISNERTEEAKILLDMFTELNNKGLEPALKIPTLPEQVLLKDVSAKMKGIKRIPIGIEKGTLITRTFNLTAEIGKLVLSSKMKYLKSFINSFLDELIVTKENLIIIDSISDNQKLTEKTKNYINKSYDQSIDKIIEFLEKSKEIKEKNTVIVINSVGKLLGKLEDTNKISELFNKCQEVGNAFIVIFDEPSKISDLTYEEWFKKIDVSEGLYIGPGVEDQNILKVSNYSRELSQKLPNNYGFYISEGNYNIIKLIEFERMEESEDDEE